MSEPRWWSQPFPPEGGQTAEGIKRQLGRPGLPEYAVLVREAVQNSWDARRDDREGPVHFRIELRRLGNLALAWRDLLGTDSGEDRGRLGKLHSNSWVMTISDRETNGLGGPIRSDEPHAPDSGADFVQFVRNVGEPRDKHLGGGTYGFGKGIFYRVSQAGAILVDTLNKDANEHSRRLMGAALGGIEASPDGRRLTGRHWWGAVNDDVPDPLMGRDAEMISAQLGLPGFADGRTGTDVTVILPNLDLDDLAGDASRLAERLRAYLYWHLWPKMGSLVRRQDIRFTLRVNGEELDFPRLDSLPVLSDYAKSLDGVRSRRGTDFIMSTHEKRYGRLGHLSIESTMPGLFAGPDAIWRSISAAAPIDAPYRHIARMRQTELIVDYFAGEPMPTADIGYVGAFVTAAGVDEFFAQAEPPTHDAWETGALCGAARGVVQGSKRFVADECRKQVEARTGVKSKAVQGLGRLSTSLGVLIQGAMGTRPVRDGRDSRNGSPGNSGRKSVAHVRTVRSSHVVIDAGVPYVELVVDVPEAVAAAGTKLVADATVLLAGGRSEKPSEAPAATSGPEILYWYREGEPMNRVAGATLGENELVPGVWRVRARALPDVSVRLKYSQEVSGG